MAIPIIHTFDPMTEFLEFSGSVPSHLFRIVNLAVPRSYKVTSTGLESLHWLLSLEWKLLLYSPYVEVVQ
jgi:hypothetical protein